MLGDVLPVLLQAAGAAVDTAVHGAGIDSVRMDQSPLPGGVANIFRFLFSGVPQWIQIGGVVVGAIVAVAVAVVAWKRRVEIAAWLGARSRGYKMALGAGIATTLLAAGLTGGWTYNYMMHENDFCSSCHVMSSAFDRFQSSEHSKLECHACHQQSIFASAKELYYWVMDRPEKIPTHSPVPNTICAECHITEKRDSVWQFISATAGHQVHMQSDSTALRDVMCVSCHAKEVHSFVPTDMSCKQSGCHDDIKVRLGRMADQTSLHCATCHEFSRPVNELAPLDSGRQGLVPLKPQCFTCHEMREKLEARGLDKDPHDAKCGICHNPHEQEQAGAAIKSCATSECHANADTLTAFHRGLPDHALDDCTQCHVAHSWKVESTDCITCHRTIFDDRTPARSLLRRAAAATGAIRRGDASSPPMSAVAPYVPHGVAPTGRDATRSPAATPPTPPTPPLGTPLTTPHAAPHAAPSPVRVSQGRSTASRSVPAHPAQPTAPRVRRSGPSADDGALEGRPWWSDDAPQAVTPVQQGAPRPSGAPFQHSRHRAVACTTCHSNAREHGALIVRDAASCQACHHAPTQQSECSACHAAAAIAPARPTTVSMRVSARDTTITRTLAFEHARHTTQSCATCHAESVDRTVIKDCAGCHVEHHAVERSCISCHPTPREGHARETHDGCASCHRDAVVAVLPPARGLCLSCHQPQLEHYPAKDCVACHRVSWNELPPRGESR